MDEQKPQPELGDILRQMNAQCGTLFTADKLYLISPSLMQMFTSPLTVQPHIYGVRSLKEGEPRLGMPQRRDSDERLVEPSVAAYLEDWFTR